MLANHGARVEYAPASRSRFVPPNGLLTVPEAAKVLGTNRVRVLRMGVARKLKLKPGRGRRVTLAACRALLALTPAERSLAMYTGGTR